MHEVESCVTVVTVVAPKHRHPSPLPLRAPHKSLSQAPGLAQGDLVGSGQAGWVLGDPEIVPEP